MKIAMNNGLFEELNDQEMFIIDGGDAARQRATSKSVSFMGTTSRNSVVNAQATVTGYGFALVGLAAAVPTGGASLALAGAALGVATVGVATL